MQNVETEIIVGFKNMEVLRKAFVKWLNLKGLKAFETSFSNFNSYQSAVNMYSFKRSNPFFLDLKIYQNISLILCTRFVAKGTFFCGASENRLWTTIAFICPCTILIAVIFLFALEDLHLESELKGGYRILSEKRQNHFHPLHRS